MVSLDVGSAVTAGVRESVDYREGKGTFVPVERLLRDATSRNDQRNDHRDDALHMKRCPLVWQVDVHRCTKSSIITSAHTNVRLV